MTDLKSVSISKSNFIFQTTKAAHSAALFSYEVSMSDFYKTVKTEAADEFTEKRSRFIGYCKPVKTEEEATAFINEIRAKHWDARHNVYAYSLREGNLRRYSDDGEPSGTAGMPVLDVITKNDIYDVCVVVTRYFGGVLLGKGGLVRAYAQGAKLALEAGQIIKMQSCLNCSLTCNYTRYGKISTLLIEQGAVIDDTVYEADVLIKFHIPSELLPNVNKKLADITAGESEAQGSEEKFYIFE